VLALGQIFVTFGSLASTPITVNYLCECFTHNPAETAIVLNTFRISLGLTVTFYINEWVAGVGFGWTYGITAFLEIFSFLAVMALMWKGHIIRFYSIGHLASSEEGEKVVGRDAFHNEKSG
jgi:hypothetical protein